MLEVPHLKYCMAVLYFHRMKEYLSDKIIAFNQSLHFSDSLPKGFRVLNPFLDNPETMEVMKRFYDKFYHDRHKRKFIIGINPSRLGAGTTGVPFTDTKRLDAVCGIKMKTATTHGVSSSFVYEVIQEYGGPKKFFGEFYINSPFPLAIVRKVKGNREVNANYYDSRGLYKAVKGYMTETLKKHIALGLETDEVYSLGIRNAKFLEELNQETRLFGKIIALEHPRFIQQYKSKEKKYYMDKYILSFSGHANQVKPLH